MSLFQWHNRRTWLALALFMLPMSSAISSGLDPASDQTKAPADRTDCRTLMTQAAVNNCAVKLAKEADTALNQTYQKLQSTLSASQENLLITAQLSWIRFRDDHCLLEKSFQHDGTLSTTSQLTCIQRLSDGREKELRHLLNTQNFYQKTSPPSQDEHAQTLISADRIGPAVIGKTLGELRRSLASNDSLQAKQKLMVDFDAIPLAREGKIQLYILFPEGTTVTDKSVIRSLLTKNTHYKTREGVGPGMKLIEAEKIYGEATLFYNTSNESREYATFAKQPSRLIRFGVNRRGFGLAGNYPKPEKEFNQTQRFHQSASIAYVQVANP